MNRTTLWLSAAMVACFALFPNYVGSAVKGPAPSTEGNETERLVLEILGMTCTGCENRIEAALSDVEGVVRVDATYQDAAAVVEVTKSDVPFRKALAAAVEGAGFEFVSVTSRGDANAADAASGADAASAADAHSASDAPKPSLAGHWTAQVPLKDGETVGFVIDLDRLGSRWVGEFDVVEYEVENYPVDVSLSGPTVKLHLAGPDADFEGTQSTDGKSLSGLLTFGDQQIRTDLRRTGDAQFSEMFLALEAAADDSSSVERLSESGAELRRRFNDDKDKIRLLMLLSPT